MSDLGGDGGKIVDLRAGDVVILPAARAISEFRKPDLLVVGAYPPAGKYDECMGSREEHARSAEAAGVRNRLVTRPLSERVQTIR